MSLLPESASFEERVQDCFLAHRGAGLMLSALDAELLEGWADREVPFEVVARGIRRAAEASLWDARPGEPALRSLRACKRHVEAEIKKYLGRAARDEGAQAEAEPAHRVRHRKLCGALRKLSREQPALERACGALLSGIAARPPSDLAEAAEREEAVYVLLVRGLPFAERLDLLREARQLAQNGVAMSARARKMARRFHRAAVARRRLSLPSFW